MNRLEMGEELAPALEEKFAQVAIGAHKRS